MRRFALLFICLISLWLSLSTAYAASGSATQQPAPVNWDRHDTAVYVVSTLNLLHTRDGRTVVSVLANRFGVVRYQVYADTRVQDLYFVQLRRSNGGVAGGFVYQMGWQLPAGASSLTNRLGVHPAPARLLDAYRNDPRQLLESFTSTLPQ